jgi:pSer/pThr/pTyr-binding forkhead associated (FHA) protein
MKVKLVVVGGKKAGMEIPITTPTFLIGRGEGCHIRPQDNFVNQIHCQISVDNKGTAAIDDSSGAVGTFVNGEKIKWRRNLKHGDRIKVATLELEIQYNADEEDAKEPLPTAPVVAPRVVVQANDDHEPDIAEWVGEDGKKADKHVLNPALPLATLAGIDAGKARVAAAATSARQERQQRPRWREIEVEWEGTDLLLFATIAIMVIVVLCMTIPIIPWPDWHWHPMRWYWTRICWYWTYRSWVKFSVIGFFLALVSLLLWLRARRLNRMQT